MDKSEQLIILYDNLAKLRHEGVKMKEIASQINVSPSVLSALYATVLPIFCEDAAELGFDKSLDKALSNVNNLSRKKLMEILDDMSASVKSLLNKQNTKGVHPFIQFLKNATLASSEKLGNLQGTYMSYSCSSSVRALKAEPYYFKESENHNCFAVGRKSVHDSIREGIGIIQEQQILYLLLNAFKKPNMSLLTVYLQLPFLEDIQYLKGIYLVPDYNKNPIARRIVLVKISDDTDYESFQNIDARIIMPEEFSEEQKLIYDYTCGDTDYIKMCTIPSPKLDLRDLRAEKDLLGKENDF